VPTRRWHRRHRVGAQHTCLEEHARLVAGSAGGVDQGLLLFFDIRSASREKAQTA
jgi:hypothetical protein